MKKLLILSLVVVFAFLGTQAFASPPIAPPVEGFIIHSFTEIVSDPDAKGKNSVTESEKFDWTYYEGWGEGVFYPNGYTPAPCCGTFTSQPCCGTTSPFGTGTQPTYYPNNLVTKELGFREGAQIAYEQTFEAKDGTVEFTKTFDAKSDPDDGDNNLVVNKKIDFEALDPTVGYAKHTEKVGLSVISMGGKDSPGTNASGLLSLCPWASSSATGSAGGGYPPTNEGIAAGSSFNVTKLVGFESNSVVNSSINPALSYDVTGQGEGKISAGFVVELWEGPKGYIWGPVKVGTAGCLTGAAGCACDPRGGTDCYILPKFFGEPPLASRTSYVEKASAEGVWTFTKQVSYESVMPGSAGAGTFPFNQVP